MDMMNKERFRDITITQAAGEFALVIGVLWIISFACSMGGLRHPILTHVGNIAAILSIFILTKYISGYCRLVKPLGFAKRFSLAWYTCLFASLLTTMAQYIYFRFIDQGYMIGTVTSIMETKEYTDALRQLMPGTEPAEVLEMIKQLTVGDITLEVLTFNLIISFPISLLTAFAGRVTKK